MRQSSLRNAGVPNVIFHDLLPEIETKTQFVQLTQGSPPAEKIQPPNQVSAAGGQLIAQTISESSMLLKTQGLNRIGPSEAADVLSVGKMRIWRASPSEIKMAMSSVSNTNAGSTANELWTAANKFANWLEKCRYMSYDPYDIWGTGYGRLARRLYYKKNPAGALMTAPLVLMEIIFPSLRGLFIKKDRFPTSDAQLALAFLNLYEASQVHLSPSDGQPTEAYSNQPSGSWLTKARTLADELLSQSIPGYSGYCWGYPFDWQNVNGLMPKGTPHITATPYCYEVFTRLFDLTGEDRYLEVARSITAFVYQDLKDTPTGKDAAASSYTPNDCGKVVNASAYRAFVLFDAARRFQSEDFRTKAWKNLQFILQSQRTDGSWLYAIDNPAEAFIDHFHTCFVLKNLHKINRDLQSTAVREAIERGYKWYRKALFDKEDNPISFAIAPRVQIVRLEMYNFAEAISLGVLLKHNIPEGFALAEKLAARLMHGYGLPAGHWVTRVYLGGVRHKVPFMRWPQSQLFLALTNLLVAARDRGSAVSDKIPQ
jgi:hypothetical protein